MAKEQKNPALSVLIWKSKKSRYAGNFALLFNIYIFLNCIYIGCHLLPYLSSALASGGGSKSMETFRSCLVYS